MQFKTVSPTDAAKLIKGGAMFVDIREKEEAAKESIPGALNAPMSALATCDCPPDKQLVFHCRSGMRTQMAAQQLADWAGRDIFILEGGIDAWRKAGNKTNVNAAVKAPPLDIQRQVQITAGALILIGALGAVYIAPALVWLSAVMGAGLLFTGLSGNCMMAKALMLMPWNRPATA